MDNAGYVALSRQLTLGRQMEVIANNMANINTNGYRGEQLLFKEFLAGTAGIDGKREKISFVQDLSQLRDLSVGPMATTGAPLDVAIDGPGYFVIETEAGTRYSRDGHFKLDPQGQIVTTTGDPVQSTSGPLVVPPDAEDIQIARDGTVSTDQGELGRLNLVTFDNEQLLKRVQNNYYDAEEAKVSPSPESQVIQGALETSNVHGVVEMTKMISTLRAYQSAQKLVEQEHERQRRAIQSLVSNN